MKLSRKSRWFMIVLVFAATATGIGFVLAQTAAPPQNQAPSDFNINDKHEVLTNDAGLRYVVDPRFEERARECIQVARLTNPIWLA
jgi:hypothetical protein